jgi:hypothetical protein
MKEGNHGFDYLCPANYDDEVEFKLKDYPKDKFVSGIFSVEEGELIWATDAIWFGGADESFEEVVTNLNPEYYCLICVGHL